MSEDYSGGGGLMLIFGGLALACVVALGGIIWFVIKMIENPNFFL